MTMSTVINWQGVLGIRLQVPSSSRKGDEVCRNFELTKASPSASTMHSKRLSCSLSYESVLLHSRICRWPSSSLSRSHGRLRIIPRCDKEGFHLSMPGDLPHRRRVSWKALSSKTNSSITSGSPGDDEEVRAETADFVPIKIYEQDSLSLDSESDGARKEAGIVTSEDIMSSEVNPHVTETECDDDAKHLGIPLDKPRKALKYLVRALSGASLRELESIMQHKSQSTKSLTRNPLRLLYQTDPSPTEGGRKKLADGWRRAETDFFAFSRQLGKYVAIMSGTGAIMVAGLELGGGSPHEQGVLGFSWLCGVVIGSMIGAGQVLKEHAMAGQRNVLITGSTRGLGKALAREFLRHGDNVVITSRSADSVESTIEELRKETLELSGRLNTSDAKLELFGLPSPKRKVPKVIGIACDVSKTDDVKALADYAVKDLGTVDLWINNAGVNKGFRPLLEFSGEELEQIVSTNLTGSIICTREAVLLMKTQRKGGHIFNMDGAGSGGSSTPLTAAYGATKCGLKQLSASLLEEVRGSSVGIHTASPGMVLTDLLLSGASLQNKKMFNFICEQPETVARALVPNLRLVSGTGKAVNYLTPARIVFAIVSLWIRRGRWFDEEGRALYAAEAERLRLWAEGRERSPVTVAMELVPSGTWVSIFSSSLICAYLILMSASNGDVPGI